MLDAVNTLTALRGARLIHGEPRCVVFVTSLLRAREIKMADALRSVGWKVILIYIQNTPFDPEQHFDLVIRAASEAEAHRHASAMAPRVCHVFSGAVDNLVLKFVREKPGPVVIDLNDIFCPSLFDYCHERFEPTRECLEKATALCARDLQAQRAERLDGYRLPRYKLLFPEHPRWPQPQDWPADAKADDGEVRVVSVGTFCLETHGMYDSAYLQLARMLTAQQIHFHIYPHWFYQKKAGSAFNWDLEKDFADFLALQKETPYLHVHQSLPLDELAAALPRYDYGIVSGGCADFGQRLQMLKPEYMRACYSGRIADYLEAFLPVLVNREVAFNYWLLERYRLVVDLAGVLRPGFRDSLLAMKRERRAGHAMKAAAPRLALYANVHRLTGFYQRIMDESRTCRVALGMRGQIVKTVPLLREPALHLQSAVQTLNGTVERLDHDLAAARLEVRRERTARHDSERELAAAKAQAAELGRRLSAAEADGRRHADLLQRLQRRNAERETGTSLEDALLNLELERGPSWQNEVSGLLNWPEIREEIEQSNGMLQLLEMTRLFSTGSGPTHQLSSCWQVLSFKNYNQLLRDGYRNFKRTLACNYFTFLVQKNDAQIAFLENALPEEVRSECRSAAARLPDDPGFEWHDQVSYRYFVLLLWAYVRRVDRERYLDRLREPHEGHPVIVPAGADEATQDLANSLLEYYAMREQVPFGRIRRALEIGPGYGRTAYVALALNPGLQYTLVDVPPALWVAQRYLGSVFKDRRVFRVRDFRHYDEVREEMEQASIVCLLPHQLELMPDMHYDLALNISSFGEMRRNQLESYFRTLERVTRGHFYTKQWKSAQNAFDNVAYTEADYPVSPRWERVYSRTCPVQSDFFEALYRVPGETP